MSFDRLVKMPWNGTLRFDTRVGMWNCPVGKSCWLQPSPLAALGGDGREISESLHAYGFVSRRICTCELKHARHFCEHVT